MKIPGNYDLWEDHEAEQERRLAERPVCADCGEQIQDDHFYLINDEAIDPDCLEAGYRKETDDFRGISNG